MSANLLELKIVVDPGTGEATLTRLVGGLDRLASSAGKTDASLGRLGANVIKLNQGLDLIERLGHGAESAFHAIVAPIVESGNELLNLSRRFGTTVGEINALEHIAEIAGVSLEDMSQGVRTLNIQLAGVHQPGSQAAEILRVLGLSGKALDDFLKLDTAERFRVLIERFAEFKDTPERFAAGVQLFGRSFIQLNQIINTGTKESREELLAFAKQYGFQVDQATALAAEKVKTGFSKIEVASQGFFRRVVGEQSLRGIAEVVDKTAVSLGRFANAIPQSTFDAIGHAVLTIADSAARATESLAHLAVSPEVIGSFEHLAHVIERASEELEKLAQNRLTPGQLLGDIAAGGLGLAGGNVGTAVSGLLVARELGELSFKASPAVRGGLALAGGVAGAVAAQATQPGGITREEAVGATGLSIGGAITIATGLPLSLTVPSVTLITQALLTESGRSFLQEALATLEGHPSTAVTSALDKVAMGIEDAGQRLTNALVEMGLLPRSLALFTQPGTGQQQPFPLPPVPPEPHEETAAERITREQAETATRLRLANRSAFFVEENRVQASVAEPFTPASPEDVAQSRRELRTFPTVARPTADSERKLADLRGELAALEDPTRIVASEVDKIVQGFTGTGLEEAVRKVADQTVRMKIDRQIGDVIR